MIEHISKKIEQCLIASAWVKPESLVENTPELFKIINPTAPFGFLNGIYRTNLNYSQELEATITFHYDNYKNQKISFRWYTFPHSKPTNLNSLLYSKQPSSITQMQGLYLEGKDFLLEIPHDITVEELNQNNLEDYIRVNNEGWGQTGIQAEKVREEIKRDFESGNMNYQSFLARYKSIPAATALLRTIENIGYLQGGSCSPKYRGKGLYRGLVAHRLSLLSNNGIRTALIAARKDTSAPICRKLGFKIGCEINCFNFDF